METENKTYNAILIKQGEMTIFEADASQKELFKNLINFQYHDLSAYRDHFDIDENGQFDWNFDAAFEANDHHPLLIKYKDKIVGCIIFSMYENAEYDYQIHEMFILRKYRNKKVGKQALRMIFSNFPGKYRVDVMEKNTAGTKFWLSSIIECGGSYVSKEIVDNEVIYNCYEFTISE